MFKKTAVALMLCTASLSAQAVTLPVDSMTITGFQFTASDDTNSFGTITETDGGSAINAPTDLVNNINGDVINFIFLGVLTHAGTTASSTGSLTPTSGGSGNVSIDLSSWHWEFNGNDMQQGGIATGSATNVAPGIWNYTANWSSAFASDTPFPGFTGNWQISGQLQAVPEADTYAMMLAGLGLIGLLARHRNLG